MKVKEYTVEVVSTTQVVVKIPETFDDLIIGEWEDGLWKLEGETREEKLRDIAKYAAKMAVHCPYGTHDGLGKLHTSQFSKPDYSKDKYTVVAVDMWQEDEEEILEEKDWQEIDFKG